jgi:hypothetical protein
MNRSLAASVLHTFLEPYRARSCGELQGLLLAPIATEIRAPSGKRFQLLVQAAWVDRPGAALRVVAGIDDGGWQRFTPLVESFVVEPPPPPSADVRASAARAGDGDSPNAR